MDPFASIDEECGKISDSQEERLLYSHFLSDLSPADTIFHSSPGDERGDHAPPYRVTERMVRTLSDGPDRGGNDVSCLDNGVHRQQDQGLGSGLPEEEIARRFETSSDGKLPQERGSAVKKSLSSRSKPSDRDDVRCPGLPPSSASSSPKDVTGSSRPASEGAPGLRKLPPSIQSIGNDTDVGTSTLLPSPITEEQTCKSESVARAHNPSVSDQVLEKDRNSGFPADLLDVVKAFSANPSEQFKDIDILEVAAMKGIHFPPPRWWRPGGYDVQRDNQIHKAGNGVDVDTRDQMIQKKCAPADRSNQPPT